MKTINERFDAKVNRSENCWLWTGAKNSSGYGSFLMNGKMVGAHRASYALFIGPIPDGLVLDHLCRIRHCVNPDHLEPVTNAENVARGTNSGAVAVRENRCHKGHSLDDAYLSRVSNKRYCRPCALARAEAGRERRRK